MEPVAEHAWRTARKVGVFVLAVGALTAVAAATAEGIVLGAAVGAATPLAVLAVMALVERLVVHRETPASVEAVA